jgi:hypothetical protein
MSIIIGGSGSSGSTMLIRKLSTHPEVFSGDEIDFFNKEQLFEDWDRNKLKILPYFPYFSTKGWQVYRRSALQREEYGWTKREIRKLLKSSSSINEFTKAYFERPVSRKKARLWIEKTPSNCYSFRHFLEQYPEGKVVHIVRNPLDSAASMYNKSPRVYYAVGTWLYNNAAALTVADSDRYHRVKYEDLVYNQDETFAKLCDFLGIDSAGLVLEIKGKTEKHIESWSNSPFAKISTSSMGKFQKLSEDIKDEIYTAFDRFEVSEAHQKANNIVLSDFYSVASELGYETEIFPKPELVKKLTSDLKKDKRVRTLKMYHTGGSYYPLSMKK